METPEVAVIHDVDRIEEFTAQRGKGAWLDERPIVVSGEADLARSLIATGFPYDRNIHGRAYAATLGEVLTRVQGIRRFGSAALDLAWVACGRYEGYWESGTQPWDAGAGVLLIEEAGGRVTNLDRDPHRLDDSRDRRNQRSHPRGADRRPPQRDEHAAHRPGRDRSPGSQCGGDR